MIAPRWHACKASIDQIDAMLGANEMRSHMRECDARDAVPDVELLAHLVDSLEAKHGDRRWAVVALSALRTQLASASNVPARVVDRSQPVVILTDDDHTETVY